GLADTAVRAGDQRLSIRELHADLPRRAGVLTTAVRDFAAGAEDEDVGRAPAAGSRLTRLTDISTTRAPGLRDARVVLPLAGFSLACLSLAFVFSFAFFLVTLICVVVMRP